MSKNQSLKASKDGRIKLKIKTKMRKRSGRFLMDRDATRQPSISATHFRKKGGNDILNSIIEKHKETQDLHKGCILSRFRKKRARTQIRSNSRKSKKSQKSQVSRSRSKSKGKRSLSKKSHPYIEVPFLNRTSKQFSKASLIDLHKDKKT